MTQAMTKAELLDKGAGPAWTGEVKGVGTVSIRLINGDDYDYIKGSTGSAPDERGIAARWVVAGVCDEAGKPLFSRNETAAVNAMPFNRLKALAVAVQEHCGITEEDAGEAEGNLQATPASGSGSD